MGAQAPGGRRQRVADGGTRLIAGGSEPIAPRRRM